MKPQGVSTAFALLAVLCVVLGLIHPRLPNISRRSYSYPSDVVNLTRALVNSGQDEPTYYAAEWLRAVNLSVTIHELNGTGRSNVVAVVPGSSTRDAKVVLFTHLDVVPGGPQLDLSGASGRLIGRGTTDARGIAAAMMVAAAEMRHPDVVLLLVTGEETTHDGVRHAFDNLGFADNITLVNGEPTEARIAKNQKGMLRFHVDVAGTACHSGYPHRGRSAILELLDFLNELRNAEWPCDDQGRRCTTLNIGQINAGQAANVVPGDAKAVISIRTIGNPDDMLGIVRNVAVKFENLQVHSVKSSPPIEFYVPERAAQKFGTISVAYNTDVSSVHGLYARAVLFGASTIELAHTVHEFVTVEDLKIMPPAYVEIVTELLEITE